MVRGRTPDLCWRLMDAQHWASPRLARRQRIFLVADFGGRRSHEILFKPRTMQSLPAFGRDSGLPAACGDRGSFIEAGRRVPVTRPFQCFRMRASAKERTETAFRNSFGLPTDPFPTLLAGGISPFAFWYEDDPAGGCVRFPTETECERLMGLPEGWTKYGADGEEILSSHRYRALGNAIALPCAEYIMAGIAEALTKGGANDGMVTLIGILLFSALLSFSTYQNKYAFDQNAGEGSGKAAVEIDKEIAAKYEGILTDEKVRQMMSDFAPTSDLHGLNAAYIYQNAMQSAAFSRFSDLNGNWNGLSVSDVFGNEEIKIGYVDGWLSTSKNMVRVFIALALAVIIMLAPIFSGEYEGVDNIILTSKYGKTKCATAKVVAGILTAILTTALIVAFNLFLARAFYGTEGLNCSILFAPSEYVEAFIPFNITCGTLLKYQILLAFTCTISVTGITLLMSAISKNQIVALVAAMAIFLFPVLLPIPETNPLFRLVGLLPVYHVLAVSLLSVEQMSNGMLYAIWAIPTALIFLGIGAGFSRHIFAKHQVS